MMVNQRYQLDIIDVACGIQQQLQRLTLQQKRTHEIGILGNQDALVSNRNLV